MLTPHTLRPGSVPHQADRISDRRYLEKMSGVILSASAQARASGPRRFKVLRRSANVIHSTVPNGMASKNRITK